MNLIHLDTDQDYIASMLSLLFSWLVLEHTRNSDNLEVFHYLLECTRMVGYTLRMVQLLFVHIVLKHSYRILQVLDRFDYCKYRRCNICNFGRRF